MKTRKRNRLMALALCLCMMVTMLPLAGTVYAADGSFTVDGIHYQVTKEEAPGGAGKTGQNTVTVTGGSPDANGKLTIPGSITGNPGSAGTVYEVTHIGESAFNWGGDIKRLELPQTGSLSIGKGAFYNTGISGTLSIPSSVTSIGDSAFRNTKISGTLSIPSSVTSIGKDAFSGLGGINKLELPQSGSFSIGDYAFAGTGITDTLTIPAGVTSIGESAFFGTKISGTLSIPSSVTSIGKDAFSGLGGINKLELPQSGSLSIGYRAFQGTGISGTLSIPSSVTSIGEDAFFDLSGITALELPQSGSLSIGAMAFQGTGISGTLSIPSSVTSIGKDAFSGLGGINKLELPQSGSLSIGYRAFFGTGISGTLSIPSSVTSIGDSAFRNTKISGTLSIPSSVTSIGEDAFFDLSGITALELPQSGSLSIGATAFQGTGISGTLSIPSGVTSIGESAFYGLSGITALELPQSGSLSIGKDAFRNTGISGTLSIPSGVASIGESAFYGLGGIDKLELPQSGSLSIGDYAFAGTGITDTLTIPAGVTSIGAGAFSGSGGINKLELPQTGSLSIGANAFENTGISGTLTIPSSVTNIGNRAFFAAVGIKELKLPQSGSFSIGDSAFQGTGISGTLSIPSSVTSIGASAFYGLGGINKLELPQSGSLSIGAYAFYGAGISGTLSIPSSVTSIGESAFRSCGSLTAVDFSSYTGGLGRFAFGECPKLATLTFMQSPAPVFDRDAFDQMPASGTVHYPAGASGYTPGGFAAGKLGGWTFTPVSVSAPSAPSITQVTPGKESISFSWSSAVNGGSDILRYEYSVSEAGDQWVAAENGRSSATVSGLKRNTEHTVKVRAVNSVGNGKEAVRSVTTLFDPPDAPRNPKAAPSGLNASLGQAMLDLSWDAPASDGGGGIIKYQYSVSAAEPSDDWKDIPDSNASTTSYTLGGLQGSTAYYLKVRAVNQAGAGAAVETSATTLPTKPGVPRDLTASPGNGEVTLTWKTPESDGGARIAKYYYSANNGNSPITPIVSIPDSDAGTTSYTVTGLENDTEYTFMVWAYNSAGDGEKASAKATPKSSPPGSPQGLTLSAGDGQVTLSWTAPASDGGAPITKYQYQYEEGQISIRPPQWQDIPGSGASTTSHTITGLKNDQSYTIKVRAVNRAGEGEEASIAIYPCKVTVKTKDGAPLSGIQVTVWRGSTQVGRTLVTDETGSFSTLIARGRYTVKAGGLAGDGVHYAEQSKTVIAILPTSVDFNLEPVVEPALSFADSDGYDIPASTVGTAIAEIDVSGGVSGGKPPYTFTADGLPAGISISETGIISGTPTEEKEAGTATITVTDSDKTSKEITINFGEITKPATKQVAAPVFSPAGGTYDSPQSVKITCATEGAEIHYTTDGSAPTAGSTKYTGAIGVSETMTIKAMAVKSGMADSEITEAAYTIQIPPIHSHSWSEEWSSDNSNHWHECTAAGCPTTNNSEKNGYGAHTESDWITTKQPTETEAGSKKKECTVCKRELVTEEIPMLDPGHVHSLTHIQAKAATCVEDGHTEYYYCESCGKYFSDNAGATEIELSSTAIPATEIHTVGDGWQHDAANHWKVCSVCNQEVEKAAHSGGTANCHAKAGCEVCGAEYGSLNPANHDGKTEIRGKKDATETEEGYTGDTYCLGCGELIKKGEVIPKKKPGHTHEFGGEWKSDAENHWQLCTAGDGEVGNKATHSGGTANCHQKAVCKTCGAEYGSLNPANHDGKTEVRGQKDATKTEKGYTGDTYCLGCGAKIKTGTVIPATGHIHKFEGDWQSDSTHHWRLCTAGDGKAGNRATHTASGWIEDKNLSENELSKRYQECTVCSYRMATVIIVKSDGIVEVTPGKDSNWTFYGDFKDLKAIKLNGVPMGIEPQSETSANLTYPGYEGIAGTAKAGSVEVTLYADFLKTLPAGAYTLEAEFASGKTTSIGSTEFTVSNDSKSEPKPDPNDPAPDKEPTAPTDVPATGDTRHVWPWVLLMLAALAVCGSLLAYWRIRNKKRHR